MLTSSVSGIASPSTSLHRSPAWCVKARSVSAYEISHESLSRTCPARSSPFTRAASSAAPTSASTSGSLYEMAVNRWNSTNPRASSPACSCWPARKTRSAGTNTSSKSVDVSTILRFAESGNSASLFPFVERYGLATSVSPCVSRGTAKATA